MARWRWIFGLLIIVLGAPGPLGAQEPLRAGQWSLALAGGASASHDFSEIDLDVIYGYQLLPHVGYVVTDEKGSSWRRGNFQLLAEPTLIRLDAEPSATVAGLSAVGRWLFSGTGVVRPFVEGGFGVLGGQVDLRETNCDVNFLLQGGAGALFFVDRTVAISLTYRFQHISNAYRCSQNAGINSSAVVVGVEWFFP
ncbi:MAG TPA: acyloxyacyl hydrolase [Methylomirabilota bacterium]|nr:acyloxyacyl hydrolase [Methylomirabilota bacterium]